MTGRLEISGGSPTDVELAAIVVALTPTVAGGEGPTGASGWQLAGIVESHGRSLVAQATDLDRPGGW